MSHLAVWIHTPIAQALGWTLAHFIWEGALLAAILMALLRLFRAAPARRRYALACLILAAMPVAFAATLAVTWSLQPAPIAVVVHWAPPAAAPMSAAVPAPAPAPRSWMADVFDRLAWLVPVWLVGVAFFYVRGVVGWAAVQRLRRRGVCAPPPAWQARLDELAARLRLSRPVALLESCLTDTPVLIGYLRPVVLLPLGCLTGLSAAQVECILLHERAHVARHDYLVNLLQFVVEGLLFYHPAVWWASRVVRAERENCCDDRVVELMGDARSYAATLAALEQRRAPAPKTALVATGGNLMQRIRRLTMEQCGARTSPAPAVSAALLLAIFAAALAAVPAKLPLARHARVAGVALAAAAPQAADLATPYRKWLAEDVAYIITDAERAEFSKLTTDEEREKFIEQFWLRRDPTPGTVENEFKEEHYRRIAYANQHFSADVPGWKTDRGRIYITYGPPDEIEDHSSGGDTSAVPSQMWRYRYIEGIGNNVVIEFVDPTRSGEFRMKAPAAATPYRKWINEDVAYIVTGEERAAFLRLQTDAEREKFIANFWQRRGAAFKEEHYRRIAYANEHFASGIPGWKTDRGRIYIVYGPPDAIASNGSGSIKWTYRHIEGIGNDIAVTFDDPQGNGEFREGADIGSAGDVYRLTKGPAAGPLKADQSEKVFVSPGERAVSVIVAAASSAPSGVIGAGDVLDVSLVAAPGNLDQALASKKAECVALLRKYRPEYPGVLACNDQVRSLEQQKRGVTGNVINPQAYQQLTQLKNEENRTEAQFSGSLTRVNALQKQLSELARQLKEAQDLIASSPAISTQYNTLAEDLNLAKEAYQQAAKKNANSSKAKQAKAKMETAQLALAGFSARNQGRLPDNFQANMLEVQSKQGAISQVIQQIAQEKQKQALLESSLSNNKNLQAQAEANLIANNAAGRQVETQVTVGPDGKISVDSLGDFAAGGKTPAELQAVLGPQSTVRIAQSAGKMVTVLVPLGASRDNFHVFGEVTTPTRRVVATFEEAVTGQPAVAKALPMRAGTYHMVVAVKNMATGAARTSALDFTVE